MGYQFRIIFFFGRISQQNTAKTFARLRIARTRRNKVAETVRKLIIAKKKQITLSNFSSCISFWGVLLYHLLATRRAGTFGAYIKSCS
jgi:hypothetical protein